MCGSVNDGDPKIKWSSVSIIECFATAWVAWAMTVQALSATAFAKSTGAQTLALTPSAVVRNVVQILRGLPIRQQCHGKAVAPGLAV